MSDPLFVQTENHCHHCGDKITNEKVVENEHIFCCRGCATVFDLLDQKDLCEYYEFDPKAGVSPGEIQRDKFNYLRDEKIQSRLLQYKNERKAIVNFQIPQMHCVSCVWLLERLYRFNPAIQNSRVNFQSKELQVQYDPSIVDLSEVVFLLSSLGYEPYLSLASEKSKGIKSINRKLWLQIGIAGFAFGNIMLLSIPEYFDPFQQLPETFTNSFGFISFLLSLPVLFFADLDYFKSAIAGLRKGAINLDVPLSLGMASLFLYSSYEVFFIGGLGYFDSFSGLVFFLLLGKAFQNKTINRFSFDRDYRSFFPLYAIKIKNGVKESVPLDSLKEGDRIIIQHNGLIPADGYLLKGEGMIDYSFVTGESLPESKQLGEIIYAGGRQISTNIEVELKKTVSTSYLTNLWNNELFQKPKEPLNQLNDQAGRYFTFGVVGLALLGFFFWLPDLSAAIKVFASVLIIACPCALALSAPFAFGNGLRILSRAGFYLKNTSVIEALSRIDHVIFDKTGTLTSVEDYDIHYEGRKLSNLEEAQIKSICGQSHHPLSKGISEYLIAEELPIIDFAETPGKGISAIQREDGFKIGNWEWVGSNEPEPGVFISKNDKVIGRFLIEGHIRKRVKEMIYNLSGQYGLSICSGDTKASWKKWLEFMPSGSKVLFECNPDEKAEEVLNERSHGKRVCMIGDGLNDGLALKTSDVGLAFTDKKDSLTPSSDGVLSFRAFQNLDAILDFSKGCSTVVKISFGISILYNLIGLYFALTGILSPVIAAILMPLSSLSIVLFTTGATSILSRRFHLSKLF